MSDPQQRPQRVRTSTQRDEYTYCNPVEGRKTRQAQRKQVHAQLRTNRETLHYDCLYNSPGSTGRATITDVLFYTDRVQTWKDTCQQYYSDSSYKSDWHNIDHGLQLKVSGGLSLTINFYDSGTVMVQSADKKLWADTHFIVLKDCVEAAVTAADCDSSNIAEEESTPVSSFQLLLTPVTEVFSAVSSLYDSLTGRSPETNNTRSYSGDFSATPNSVQPTTNTVSRTPSPVRVAPMRLAPQFESACLSPDAHVELCLLDADSDCTPKDSEVRVVPDSQPEPQDIVRDTGDVAKANPEPEPKSVQPATTSASTQASSSNDENEHISLLQRRVDQLERTVHDLEGTNQKLQSDLNITRDQRDILQVKLISLQDSVDTARKSSCSCKTKKKHDKPAQTPASPKPQSSLASQARPLRPLGTGPKNDVRQGNHGRHQPVSKPKAKPNVTILSSSMGRGLATVLNQRGQVNSYGSVNPSATIQNLTNKSASVAQHETDFIVLIGGGNNISNGDRPCNVISAMETLVKTTQTNNPNVKVVVSSLLHRTTQPPHLNKRVDTVNSVLKRKAMAGGYTFMDSASKITPSHLKRDGIHLNESGVNLLGEIIEKTLRHNTSGYPSQCAQRSPFHQGHQKIQRPQPITTLVTRVRPGTPYPLSPWF